MECIEYIVCRWSATHIYIIASPAYNGTLGEECVVYEEGYFN